MHAVSNAIRSLRSKLTPTKRRNSTLYPSPSTPDTPPMTDEHLKLPLLNFEPFKPLEDVGVRPTPPRKEPSFTFDFAPAITHSKPPTPPQLPAQETPSTHLVSTQADVAASLAMLDFERKLPLSELENVGLPRETYPREKTEAAPRTLWAPKAARDVEMPGVDKAKMSPARTLSLPSTSSHSSFSFANRVALRERTYAIELDIETSSIGTLRSIDLWGMPDNSERLPLPASPDLGSTDFWKRDGKHPAVVSDEEWDALPEYSDVEDDPEFDGEVVKDGDVWSVTSKGSDEEETVMELAMPEIDIGDESLDDADNGTYASTIEDLKLMIEAAKECREEMSNSD